MLRDTTVSLCLSVLLAGCAREPADPVSPRTPKLAVTSPAFVAGGAIPKEYTCDGADQAPPLRWSGVPAGTVSQALVVDDPDAPVGTFTHWVLFNIPPGVTALDTRGGPGERIELAPGSAVAEQGRNDFGKRGYGGPCPPGGTHRYRFHLYALDCTLSAAHGADRATLLKAIRGHVVADGLLTGTYQR